jgi:sugar lactone lactonase YvrE
MKTLLSGGHFFEGARWHHDFWYVSDLYARHVLRIAVDGTSEILATVPKQPSGLGWLPNGDLLIVSMKDRRLLRRDANGVLTEHANITSLTGSFANDMVTDGLGRAYVGNLGFNLFTGESPKSTTIVRVDPDGKAVIAADQMLFPNGMVVTPDNKTLIVAETFGARLTAFTIAADGTLYDRRIWATVGKAPSWDSLHTLGQTDFAPDGCTLDKEGCVWLADALNGRVARIAEGKGIVAEIKAPDGRGLYSCTLGGSNGRQLLICTAPDFDDTKRTAKAEAVLYTVEVDVPCAGRLATPADQEGSR